MTEIIPYLFYRDVPAALDWLADAFGFQEIMRHPTPGGMHAETALGGRRIMLGQSGGSATMAPPPPGHPLSVGIFVYVPDVAAHHDRAKAAGAQIDQNLADHGYGLTYTVRDLEGQLWFFTQAPALP
jgi:PhnB protein